MEAIAFVRDLIRKGHKVAIFSCEDPYNTPFHKDLLNLTHYLHLKPNAGSLIDKASVDLGLQAKHITAFGVFGHYGIVHGKEVCAAIKALSGDYSHFGEHLKSSVDNLGRKFAYKVDKTIKDNVISWTEQQYKELQEIVAKKKKTLKGVEPGQVIIFAGIVENSSDAKSYQADVLWHTVIE